MFFTPNNFSSSQRLYNSSFYSNPIMKQPSFYLQPLKQNFENSMNLIPENLVNNLTTDKNNTNLIKHIENNTSLLIDCNNDLKLIIDKYNDKLIQTDLSIQKIQKEFEKYENIMISIIDNLKIQFDILINSNKNEIDINHYSNNYIISLDNFVDEIKNNLVKIMKIKEEECISNLNEINSECEELKIYFYIEFKKIIDHLKSINVNNKDNLNYDINDKIERIILKINKLKNELLFVNIKDINIEEKKEENNQIKNTNLKVKEKEYFFKYLRRKSKSKKYFKKEFFDL